MEFPALSGEDIEWLQDEFVKAVFKRIEESKENRFIAKEDRGKVSRADGAAQRKTVRIYFVRKLEVDPVQQLWRNSSLL